MLYYIQSVCLSSFVSLLNGNLEFIGILLTFVSDFTSSVVLSFAEFLLILVQSQALLYLNLIKHYLNTLINSSQKAVNFAI